MATSLEKLAALRDDLTAPNPDAEPFELAMRSMLQMFGPMILRQLPPDPADFDALLERGAEHLLALRSDDAPQLTIARWTKIESESEPAAGD